MRVRRARAQAYTRTLNVYSYVCGIWYAYAAYGYRR